MMFPLVNRFGVSEHQPMESFLNQLDTRLLHRLTFAGPGNTDVVVTVHVQHIYFVVLAFGHANRKLLDQNRIQHGIVLLDAIGLAINDRGKVSPYDQHLLPCPIRAVDGSEPPLTGFTALNLSLPAAVFALVQLSLEVNWCSDMLYLQAQQIVEGFEQVHIDWLGFITTGGTDIKFVLVRV